MCAESALNSYLGIVEDDTAGNTAIILEGSDNGIQKTFQILPLIGDDIRGAAVTQPGTEQVNNQLLAIDVNGSLAPVNLDSFSRSESQRNEGLSFLSSCPHIMNQIPDRGLTAAEAAFFYQTLVDSPGSIPLFQA